MKVAIYCRLSEEDKDKRHVTDDSESIQNQKSMLIQYATEQGWEIYGIYSDDDYTGADRSRPEFNRLLEDAKHKKFDIVLCKTQSRFTRELELVEKYIPTGFGAIIRTSCISATEEEISQDIQRLVNRWNNIQKDILENESDLPCLIEENNDIIKSLILGTADGKMNRIITNNEVFNKEIKNFLEVYNLDNNVKVDFEKDVFEKYTMQKELQDIENNKVWLRCGGYIVIDKTEALTAIDVNSGKCVGKDNFEDTILKVNTEAAKEITKQLRLRDIGGIIIIDFIDMQEELIKEKLLNCFVEETKKDRAKVQVEGFSKLNLLELTRKQIYGKE